MRHARSDWAVVAARRAGRRRWVAWVVAAATAIAMSSGGLGGRAAAQGAPVPAEITVILASPAEGTIDPALAAIAALRQPPFSAYRSMSMLSRREVALVAGAPFELALPNGRQLRVELAATMPDGRFRARVSITRPGQRDYLPLLEVVARPGEPFFVAGQSHLGGTLVIGLRLGVRAP